MTSSKDRVCSRSTARSCARSATRTSCSYFASMPPNMPGSRFPGRDLVQLARSRALDWVALQAKAERLGITRIVTVTFLLADKLIGAGLPAQVGAERDPGAEVLARRIVHLIVAKEEFDTESMAYFRLMMELRERRRDRASFWWRLLITPGTGEWSAVRLPGPLFP